MFPFNCNEHLRWEIVRDYLNRSYAEDDSMPSVSLTSEDDDNNVASYKSSCDLPSPPPQQITPLPDLIIEKADRDNRHDDPEEFYDTLEAKCRKFMNSSQYEDEDTDTTELIDTSQDIATDEDSVNLNADIIYTTVNSETDYRVNAQLDTSINCSFSNDIAEENKNNNNISLTAYSKENNQQRISQESFYASESAKNSDNEVLSKRIGNRNTDFDNDEDNKNYSTSKREFYTQKSNDTYEESLTFTIEDNNKPTINNQSDKNLNFNNSKNESESESQYELVLVEVQADVHRTNIFTAVDSHDREKSPILGTPTTAINKNAKSKKHLDESDMEGASWNKYISHRSNDGYEERDVTAGSNFERENSTEKTYQNVSNDPEIMRDTNRNLFRTSKFSFTTSETDHEFDISAVPHTAARKHSDIQTDKEDDDEDIHDESCEEIEYESVDLGYDLEENTFKERLQTILEKGESQIISASDSNNGDETETDHEVDISPVPHTAARKHSDIQTDKEDDDEDIHDESCEEIEYESLDLGYYLEENTYTEGLQTILEEVESQIKSASDSNNGDREKQDVTTGSATTTSEDKNASNARSISFSDFPPRPPITLPPISPLPELVIEKVHRGSRHDDPEEFYNDLEAKCRKFMNKIKRSSQYEDYNDIDILEVIDTSQDIATDIDRFNMSPDDEISNNTNNIVNSTEEKNHQPYPEDSNMDNRSTQAEFENEDFESYIMEVSDTKGKSQNKSIHRSNDEYEERDVTPGSMLQSHRNDSDDPEIMRAANNSFRTTRFSVNPHEEDHDMPEPHAASNKHSDPGSRNKDIVFLSNEYAITIYGDRQRDKSKPDNENKSQCEDENINHNSRKRRADDTDDLHQFSYDDAKSKWKAFLESIFVNPPKVCRLCFCKRKH